MSSAVVQHIVLINGWSASSAIWQEFFVAGFDGCTVDIIDLEHERTLAAYCELIDERIKPSSLLIGWSLGGELALYYSANFRSEKISSGWLKGVVAMQASPCFHARIDWPSGIAQQDFEILSGTVQTREPEELVRVFSHLLVAGSSRYKADKRLLKRIYGIDTLPSFESLACGLSLLRDLDLRLDIKKIECPVLWIMGSEDSLVSLTTRDNISAILNQVPEHKQRINVIAGMGHFPCGEYSGEVKAAINDFMDVL